jgi:hypothetical protein
MSLLTEFNLPLTVIYSDVYQNVSSQVLEIDKSVSIPPSHVWSEMLANRYLIGDDYTNRGYVTQKLIDLGYIAFAVYVPLIPQGYFFLQSYESDIWFEVDAVEVDVDDNNPLTRECVSYKSTEVVVPPPNSIINFNISIPAGIPLLLELNGTVCVDMYLDFNTSGPTNEIINISSLYRKNVVPSNLPAITTALSIPNTQNLYFDDGDSNFYTFQINDQGQFFWTLYTPSFAIIFWGLFWLTLEPILVKYSNNAISYSLGNQFWVKAFFTGTYADNSGNSGTLYYEWNREEIGSTNPGTFPVNGSKGIWTITGTMTVLP